MKKKNTKHLKIDIKRIVHRHDDEVNAIKIKEKISKLNNQNSKYT